MQLALSKNNIYIKTTREEYPIVKGLPGIKFDKAAMAWVSPLTLEMLNRLQRLVRLPPILETERQRLTKIQRKVDCERLNEKPLPLYNYPVKAKLFTHQVRGANMALYKFGWDKAGDVYVSHR